MMPAGHHSDSDSTLLPLPKSAITWFGGIFASVLVPIFKEKGDIQECKNYRGIKLLTHTFKIWERVLDRRVRECTDIHESQFGFMPGRSTTDAIFILKQTIEQYREGQKDICVTFIDLSPFHSGCFGSASSELAKGAIAYRFHSEKLIRSLVN